MSKILAPIPYTNPYFLKFAKLNCQIKFKKKLLEVFAICLFKKLDIFNFEWKTKMLKKSKERYFRRKIINRRRKTDDSTNSDVLIRMKEDRKDKERYRLLKPRFKSNYEITDKSQKIIESIFGELKVDEDIILPEKYCSSDESDEYQSRGNKNPKPKYTSELQGSQKVNVPGNGDSLF